MGCAVTESRKAVRRIALVFALVTLVFLSMEIFVMVISAMWCEASSRLGRIYVWIVQGSGCLLRSANLGCIIAWIVAASQDCLNRMMLYTTAMAVRLIGMTFYATLSALEQMLEKESIVHHIELLELHREEIFGRFSVPVIFMTSVVDALFVYMLTRYEEHLRFQARGGAPVLEANDSSSPIASLGSVPSTENVANA